MYDIEKELDSWKADIRCEYDVARENCKLYFERMYKILEFSLGVMIAVIGIDVGVLGGSQSTDSFGHIIFLYILPVCLFILGLLYTYNAYSLAVYGNEAQALRKELYSKTSGKSEIDGIMREYIKTNPRYTKKCYGVCLVFYIVAPLVSVIYGCKRILENSQFDTTGTVCESCKKLSVWVENAGVPMALWSVYLALMIILIVAIWEIFRGRKNKDKA